MPLIYNILQKRKQVRLYFYLLAFTFIFFPSDFFAQINKNGIPLIKNYSPDEYQAHDQNWAIVKDKRGVMYFANNHGLLEYNGVEWKLHENDQSAAILSLAIDEKGNIYYGSTGDFGVMVTDSLGKLNFYSLFKTLNKKAGFNAIRGIHIVRNQVIFRSSEKIFIYDNSSNPSYHKNIVQLSSETSFHKSFVVNSIFFVKETGKGLLELKNDKLVLVEGSEILSNEKIYFMAPFDRGKIIVGSRESGLYIYETSLAKKPFAKFNCEASDIIQSSYLYEGVVLPNGRFALATLANGVVIFNNNGEIEEILNTESGISDQTILTIYYDPIYSNLWFASNENGIFKANLGSPFREWNKTNGLNGVVSDIIRFKDKIYVSTNKGAFHLEKDKGKLAKLTDIQQIRDESWSFERFTIKNNENKLLIGTNAGIYEIKNNNAKLILNNGIVYTLRKSDLNEEKVYVGFIDGIGVIDYNLQKDTWKFVGRNKKINATIKSILETNRQKLFLGEMVDGVFLLKKIWDETPIHIDSTLGLPIRGTGYRVFQIEKKIVIATMMGLFEYNEKNNSIQPFKKFGTEFTGSNLGVYNILKINGGYLLSLYSNDLQKSKWQGVVRLTKNEKDSFDIDWNFAKIIPQKVAHAMYEDGDYFWIGNDKGLYKFDKTVKKNYKQPYNINFTSVTTTDDSTLFAGTFYEIKDSTVYVSLKQPEQLKPTLAYKNNEITFEYAAAFYEKEEETKYSFRLLGQTEKWSKWNKETKFPYTNLSPGDYRFEVKAKNIYGTISEPASFEFTILPPWYMTIWAYILFFICGVLFIWLIVRLKIRQLKREKIKLERIVEERTLEIRMKNAELEQQKEEITAQRDEIEVQKDHVTFQKEQIENQHNMILEQTKSITDSIHYASKIQAALLPPEEVLSKILPEHFILFRPRDIVSGDFYWASTKNNRTIIVAADCTGHGVPGAFMSMLGISFLNEIINKFKHLQASQILDEMKESVKKSLRQTGKDNEAKDGMDMALCIIDKEKMQMEFAGAYNSMFLVRNNKLIKFDADRMPVGIYVKDRGKFTNHLIDMQKGDCYYIFSDGYPDQFGGEKGSKLMIKRFKKILLEIHQMPSEKQKLVLEDFLENWQSYKDENGRKHPQVDDILVIGMRI